MAKRFKYVALLECEGPNTSEVLVVTADPETVKQVTKVLTEHISGQPVNRLCDSAAPPEQQDER